MRPEIRSELRIVQFIFHFTALKGQKSLYFRRRSLCETGRAFWQTGATERVQPALLISGGRPTPQPLDDFYGGRPLRDGARCASAGDLGGWRARARQGGVGQIKTLQARRPGGGPCSLPPHSSLPVLPCVYTNSTRHARHALRLPVN